MGRMRAFLSGLPGLPDRGGRHGRAAAPLLADLADQTLVHTRVAARGTWTVSGRGTVLSSRGQLLEGPALAPGTDPAVGLRDPRVVGARVLGADLLDDGAVRLRLETAAGPLRLGTAPPWRLEGPRGALVLADEAGAISDAPAGAAVHATDAALAAHAASRRSGIEQRLLERGRERCLHPGDVVEVLAASGALEDEEFARRGPVLLARMLVRGDLVAGFVVEGRFRPWSMPVAEVVEHVGTTWHAIGGRTPGPDMIAWFALTAAGRAALGPSSAEAMPPGMSGYDSPGVVGPFR
jgi:GNAT superfamily N-acetyltransferase